LRGARKEAREGRDNKKTQKVFFCYWVASFVFLSPFLLRYFEVKPKIIPPLTLRS